MILNSLIDALVDTLRQELHLIDSLSDSAFAHCGTGHFRSSVGKHIRHNLDHLASLLDGLCDRSVDYEARRRDADVEAIRLAARQRLLTEIKRLNALRGAADCELQIREESEASAGERRFLSSSLGRELQFVLGHTVHHHAIIAMLLVQNGLPVPEKFGMAPSTRRHEEQEQPLVGQVEVSAIQ